MDVLIKKAKIIFPGDINHLKTKDILITKGKIESISNSISAPKVKTIEAKNLCVSIGWMDIGTHIGEPGLEHRETIDSAAKAAAAGGYTDIAIMPGVSPVIDDKTQVNYISSNQPSNAVNIHVIGAVSKQMAGDDLTEMIDMSKAGVIAFGDGLKSIKDSGMMMRALQYAKSVDKPVINYALDKSLAHGGQIHEGEVSVGLGMQGISAIAEHIGVQRDLYLTKYTESKLVMHCISSGSTCDMLAAAKKDKVAVNSTVSYLNLIHTDQDLLSFNSNLKVRPPLREETDRKKLIKAIKKGTISAIVSNHVPLEEELKKLEFSYATKGATGLETCFSAMNTYLEGQVELEDLINCLTVGPREILELDIPKLKVGEKASLTLFDPNEEWIYTTKNKKSISANNPFLDQTLRGKVIATVTGITVNINA